MLCYAMLMLSCILRRCSCVAALLRCLLERPGAECIGIFCALEAGQEPREPLGLRSCGVVAACIGIYGALEAGQEPQEPLGSGI